MIKERLEEINKNVIVDRVYYKYLDGKKGHWGKTYTLNEEDYKWFIKQAEQAYAFEKSYKRTIKKQHEQIIQLREQNKLYCEAIEKGINATRYTNQEVAYILREALEESE